MRSRFLLWLYEYGPDLGAVLVIVLCLAAIGFAASAIPCT